MTSQALTLTREGAALVATIERESAANSIDLEVISGLEDAAEAVRDEDALRALVITAAGTRFFAAGGDIKRYSKLETEAELEHAFARPRALMDTLERLPKPVIAAVNGLALGGGVELLLACDLRIAAASARLGFPYTRIGVMPGWNGTERLVRDCGRATALGLLLRGATIDAAEAYRIGLVHEVVEDVALAATVTELVATLAGAAPLALAAAKRAVRACVELDQSQQRRQNTAEFAALWTSADHREAEAAFIAKRKPVFCGR